MLIFIFLLFGIFTSLVILIQQYILKTLKTAPGKYTISVYTKPYSIPVVSLLLNGSAQYLTYKDQGSDKDLTYIKKIVTGDNSPSMNAFTSGGGMAASATKPEDWGIEVVNNATPASTPTPTVVQQTEFTVILAEIGSNKISVVGVVRQIRPSLTLQEAKDLVDGAPKPVIEGVSKTDAERYKAQLEGVGATVLIK